jgi:purine-binding chemotaxis protein CheW
VRCEEKAGGEKAMEKKTTHTDQRSAKGLGGKYLTFRLGAEEYGLEILKVREIIGLMAITPVPRTPEHIRGVINLRGKVIPVIDLRRQFGMEGVNDTEQTCIIVVEVTASREAVEMGILVDTVSEVLDIGENEIQETPSLGEGIDTEFILGLAKAKNSVKILLNIEKVLSQRDAEEAVQAARRLAVGENASAQPQ